MLKILGGKYHRGEQQKKITIEFNQKLWKQEESGPAFLKYCEKKTVNPEVYFQQKHPSDIK